MDDSATTATGNRVSFGSSLEHQACDFEIARLRKALADEPGPVERLHMIADQDIGGNAPALADELHAFAARLEAEMRGEAAGVTP